MTDVVRPADLHERFAGFATTQSLAGLVRRLLNVAVPGGQPEPRPIKGLGVSKPVGSSIGLLRSFGPSV